MVLPCFTTLVRKKTIMFTLRNKREHRESKGVLHGFTMFYHITVRKKNHVYLKEQKKA